jgi:hypothetical protein
MVKLFASITRQFATSKQSLFESQIETSCLQDHKPSLSKLALICFGTWIKSVFVLLLIQFASVYCTSATRLATSVLASELCTFNCFCEQCEVQSLLWTIANTLCQQSSWCFGNCPFWQFLNAKHVSHYPLIRIEGTFITGNKVSSTTLVLKVSTFFDLCFLLLSWHQALLRNYSFDQSVFSTE